MTIVHHSGELAEAIEKAFEYDRDVLVERFVDGTEVTIAVIGNEDVVALPTLEIVPEHEFYDYDSKYVPGMSSHIIPARVSEAARLECQRLAVAAHKTLGCRGMSRADTIVEPDGTRVAARGQHHPGHDVDIAGPGCGPSSRNRVSRAVPDARGVRARADSLDPFQSIERTPTALCARELDASYGSAAFSRAEGQPSVVTLRPRCARC